MSLKALDELRGWIAATVDYGLGPDGTNLERLRDIADAIEAELSEHYMKLPVDAAGLPIHMGDMLDAPKGEEYGVMEVVELTFDGEDWYFKGEVPLSFMGLAGYFNVIGWRHYHKPRTIEDVLLDAGVSRACVEDVAAELRELMGGGE